MHFLYRRRYSGYKKVFVWIFFVLSVAFFAYTVYVFYGTQIAQYISSIYTSTSQQKLNTGTGITEDREPVSYTASGTIIFSASNQEFLDDGSNIISTNYQINAANPESGYERLFLGINTDRWNFTTPDIDTGYLVYNDNEVVSSGEDQQKVASFSLLDYEQPNFNIQDVSSEGWYERHLSYSPEQDKLLFITQENEAENLGEFYHIDNWQIQLLDLSTNEKITAARGINPVWYKETSKFLYLSRDGISVYDTATLESRLLLPTHREFTEIAGADGSYTLTTEIALSPDGKQLMLTSSAEAAIYLYSVREEDRGLVVDQRGKIDGRFNVRYYSPVISPDSNYFAVLQIRYNESDYSKALSIGSTADPGILHTIDLSKLPFASIIINGWQ